MYQRLRSEVEVKMLTPQQYQLADGRAEDRTAQKRIKAVTGLSMVAALKIEAIFAKPLKESGISRVFTLKEKDMKNEGNITTSSTEMMIISPCAEYESL